MQLDLSKSIGHPNQSLASPLLAFGLLGSFHPNYRSDANVRYRTNIVQLNQVQQSKDHFWYTPLRSPGFNDLTGS